MSDLVERLRDDQVSLIRDWDVTRDTLREAADEIERLQKHLEACSDTCGFQARQIERLQDALRTVYTWNASGDYQRDLFSMKDFAITALKGEK